MNKKCISYIYIPRTRAKHDRRWEHGFLNPVLFWYLISPFGFLQYCPFGHLTTTNSFVPPALSPFSIQIKLVSAWTMSIAEAFTSLHLTRFSDTVPLLVLDPILARTLSFLSTSMILQVVNERKIRNMDWSNLIKYVFSGNAQFSWLEIF